MSWLQGKKIVLKWNLLLFYAKTMNNFSTGLWCAIKSGFYMTAGDDQLSAGQRRCSKALPQIKLTPKEGYGHCLVVSCQSDPLQLSESWQNHYIWEVCSANQWDALKSSTTTVSTGSTERAQFCTITPGNISHNQHFKSWMNWTTKFCLIHHNHLTSH